MILLAFDDHHLKEWVNLIPWMTVNSVRATFYLSGSDRYSDEDWSMVKMLESSGHVIGYHTLHHLDVWAVPDVYKWFTEEVLKGIWIFGERGFNVRHFAYPYGRDNDTSNRLVMPIFDTIRGVVLAAHPTIQEFPNYWGAWELDRPETWKLLEESPVQSVKGVLQHSPNQPALDRLVSIAKRRGEEFINVVQAVERRGAK